MSKNKIDLVKQHPLELSDNIRRLCRSSRDIFRDGWAENIENMSGFMLQSTRQAMRANGSGSEYSDTFEGANPHGTTTVANRVLPALLRMNARVMGLVTGFQGIPASADETDKDAAKAIEKLMQAIWYNDNLYKDIVQTINFCFGTSHGYVHVESDESMDRGTKIRHRPELVTSIYAYPGIYDLNESPVIVFDTWMTQEDIERRWGEMPQGAEPAKTEVSRIRRLQSEVEHSMYNVTRVYYRPDKNRGWPYGKQYVIIGKEVVKQYVCGDAETDTWKLPKGVEEGDDWIGTGFPDPDKVETLDYPFVDFMDVPTGLGYWARGRQSAARAPQKILNTAWSKVSQVATMPGVILGLPYGAQIGVDEVGGTPVQVIKYNPVGGRGIDFWTPPTMPMYEFAISMANQWIDEVYNQPPPSRGQSPGSRFPAAGIQMLVEQAELGDSPFGKMVMDAVSRVAKKILIEGQRVWPDTMVDHVVGDSGKWERIEFRKTELQEGWDIRVIADTGLPQSRQARMQAVQNLAQFGVLGNMEDPENQKKARKLIDVYTDEDALQPDKKHRNVAKDEEEKMANGQEVPLNWYDDHAAHLALHLDVAVTKAESMSVPASKARQNHTTAHMEALTGAVQNDQATNDDQIQAAEAEAAAQQGEPRQ